MSTREEVLKLLRDKYSYLSAEYGVKRVGIFGSYARGVPDEASDIDIIVEFEHPIGFKFMELVDYLESLLGKAVDVLTLPGLKAIRVGRVAEDIRGTVMYV